MSELLQEFVDSGNQRLRVDRAAGVIRGVKLLGLASRNGRRYRENALVDAVGLYEGAKVNINHPKGHPLSPRDYQDRLGVVRGVQFRAGEGLFGDLHFNPKHALSEQLVWDAEHAPQNVGMSHNVLARTSRDGDETVVEAITKVQSIDLVADPATTSGLYEHAGSAKSEQTSSGEPTNRSLDRYSTTALLHYCSDSLTLEELRLHRPDLVREATRVVEQQLEQVRASTRRDDRPRRSVAAARADRAAVAGARLAAAGNGWRADRTSSAREFIESLMHGRRRAVDRAARSRSGPSWCAPRAMDGEAVERHRPRRSDQSRRSSRADRFAMARIRHAVAAAIAHCDRKSPDARVRAACHATR